MIQFSTARKRPVHTPCIVMVFASCHNEDGSLRNRHAEPDALGHMLRNTESRVNMMSKSLDKGTGLICLGQVLVRISCSGVVKTEVLSQH